jgi:hypothetical protein
METYNAKLISADFEESTMEFEIQHEFTVQAGDYVILHKADYEKLVSGVESENGKLPIPHVSGSLLSDIRDEMDADMEDSGVAQGEIESCLNHWNNKYVIQRKEWFSNER